MNDKKIYVVQSDEGIYDIFRAESEEVVRQHLDDEQKKSTEHYLFIEETGEITEL